MSRRKIDYKKAADKFNAHFGLPHRHFDLKSLQEFLAKCNLPYSYYFIKSLKDNNYLAKEKFGYRFTTFPIEPYQFETTQRMAHRDHYTPKRKDQKAEYTLAMTIHEAVELLKQNGYVIYRQV